MGTLLREDLPLREDISQEREAMLFSGEGNSINLKREYYKQYSCDFDLVYYPFDTQLCTMEFAVQGWTTEYVELQIDGNGVEYQGTRDLVEYEIQLEELQVMQVSNISRAVVKVVFRRRMEYHVTNIFLQTLILVSVGYLSFFFRVDNFTDRIMVTLTVMLVVATIMSTIQQQLPKTSYYKLIDYWLMFILNILACMMGFHTYLQFSIKRDKDQLFLGHLMPPFKSEQQHQARPIETSHPGKRWVGFDDGVLKNAKKINKFGKFLFLVVCVIFNVAFWSIALSEYVKSAEHYLQLG